MGILIFIFQFFFFLLSRTSAALSPSSAEFLLRVREESQLPVNFNIIDKRLW